MNTYIPKVTIVSYASHLDTQLANPHTHQVRRWDWKKDLEDGSAHQADLLCAGTEAQCQTWLQNEAEAAGCGVGLLLNNGGYRLVDLAKEQQDFIGYHAQDMYKVVTAFNDILAKNIALVPKELTSDLNALVAKMNTPVIYKQA